MYSQSQPPHMGALASKAVVLVGLVNCLLGEDGMRLGFRLYGFSVQSSSLTLTALGCRVCVRAMRGSVRVPAAQTTRITSADTRLFFLECNRQTYYKAKEPEQCDQNTVTPVIPG